MGKITKGILGGFSGKVGTVVGANFRGVDTMRSLPTKSNREGSAKQKLQRSLFAAASVFLQPVNSVVSVYFGSPVGTSSARNLAMSYTMTDVMQQNGDSIEVQYSKVLLTKGDLTGFQNMQTVPENGGLHFSWTDNSDQGNANSTDVFCAAVYDAEAELWHLQEAATRNEATATVPLPVVMTGHSVQVYTFFRTADETKACTTLYAGEVMVV